MTMTQAQQAARYFSARRLMRMMRMKQPGNLLVADITTIGRKFSMWLDAEYKIQLVERYTNEVWGEITLAQAKRLIKTDYKRVNKQ